MGARHDDIATPLTRPRQASSPRYTAQDEQETGDTEIAGEPEGFSCYMIELELPWPPSINHYYGRARNGRVFIKKAGVEFRKRVADIVADRGCESQTGNLAMFIWVSPPDKRKRDLDNLVKATQDALQEAGCYENDCQIAGLHVEREEIHKGGFVRVMIVQHRTAAQRELMAAA